jgi:apolipoprotein N-acyltransferase
MAIQNNTSTSATTVLVAAIPTRGVATIYSMFGDWLAYASVVGLLGLTGWAFGGQRRARALPSLLPAP